MALLYRDGPCTGTHWVSWMTRPTGYRFAYGFRTAFAKYGASMLVPTHACDLTTLFTGNAARRAWYFRSLTEITIARIGINRTRPIWLVPVTNRRWISRNNCGKKFPYLDRLRTFHRDNHKHKSSHWGSSDEIILQIFSVRVISLNVSLNRESISRYYETKVVVESLLTAQTACKDSSNFRSMRDCLFSRSRCLAYTFTLIMHRGEKSKEKAI